MVFSISETNHLSIQNVTAISDIHFRAWAQFLNNNSLISHALCTPAILNVNQLSDLYCGAEDTSDTETKAFTFRAAGIRDIRVTEHDVNRILRFPEANFVPDPSLDEINEFFQFIRTQQLLINNSEYMRHQLVSHWNFFFLTIHKVFSAMIRNMHGITRPLQKIGYAVAHNRRINFGKIVIELILHHMGPKETRQHANFDVECTFPRFLQLILNDVLKEEEKAAYAGSETRQCATMKMIGLTGIINKPKYINIPVVITPHMQTLGLPLQPQDRIPGEAHGMNLNPAIPNLIDVPVIAEMNVDEPSQPPVAINVHEVAIQQFLAQDTEPLQQLRLPQPQTQNMNNLNNSPLVLTNFLTRCFADITSGNSQGLQALLNNEGGEPAAQQNEQPVLQQDEEQEGSHMIQSPHNTEELQLRDAVISGEVGQESRTQEVTETETDTEQVRSTEGQGNLFNFDINDCYIPETPPAKKMDEKLSELSEKVDAITKSQADFESRMKKELAGIKESQPPQTLAENKSVFPSSHHLRHPSEKLDIFAENKSVFPSSHHIRHPSEKLDIFEMEMCLKNDLNDQMSLLGKRYFNCSDTNELIRKVGAGLESYFRSIAPPLEQIKQPSCSSAEGYINISDIAYESLPFLKLNEAEKHLYSMRNIIDFVCNAVENNWSEAPWMRLNYLVKTQEVGTEIIAEFCELLNTSLRKEIHIYCPLAWKSYAKGAKEKRLKSFFHVDKYEMVFIPIVENRHFFSIHIHVMDHCIYIVDPLYVRLQDDHQAHLNLVVDVLIGSQKFLDDGWTSYYVKNNPKQDNAYDCGVYMAKYLEYWGKK